MHSFQLFKRPYRGICVFLVAGAMGCQTLPEDIVVEDWKPVLGVPFIDTRFTLYDLVDATLESGATVPLAELEGGELAFVHVEPFQGMRASEFIQLPNGELDIVYQLSESDVQALQALPPGNVLPLQFEGEWSLPCLPSGGNIQLTGVEFKSGGLLVDVTTSLPVSGLSLRLPQMRNADDAPWVWEPQTPATDLAGWRLDSLRNGLAGWNRTPVEVSFGLQAMNGIEVGDALTLSLVFADVEMKRVGGDLGGLEFLVQDSTTTLELFDDRFQLTEVALERARVSLEVDNGWGVGIRMKAFNVQFPQIFPPTTLEYGTSGFEVPAAPYSSINPYMSKGISRTWSLNQDSANLLDFFSTEANKVSYQLAMRTEPYAGVEHVIYDFSEVKAELKVEIPLAMTSGEVAFIDTLPFDIAQAGLNLSPDSTTLPWLGSQMELDSAVLRMVLTNSLPLGMDLHIAFIDSAGNVVVDFPELQEPFVQPGPVEADGMTYEASRTAFDLSLDWSRYQDLRLADGVVFQAVGRTAELGNAPVVRVMADNALALEMGMLFYLTESF